MSGYYGKNGFLRILESSKARNLSQSGPKEAHISNEVSAIHADITADMLNPSAGTATILAVNTDRVYVGQKFQFSRIAIDLTSLASADGGLLICEYWNGSSWVAVPNLLDGTAVTANTMRQDGAIEFDIPADWVKNDVPVAGTTLFYVRFRTTTSVATDPVAQLIEPASGQFFEVYFSDVNLSAPEGHARPEEIVRSNRGQLNTAMHYIQGPDDVIVQPVSLTFSAKIDSLVNKTALLAALTAQDAVAANTWPNATISTKGDTQLRAGLTTTLVSTPLFTDPNKKTVCIQSMWDDLAGVRIWREYNEVFADPQNITLNESMDALTLNVSALIYGSIKSDISRFGYRY